MHPDITLLDHIPGEKLLADNLQQQLSFSLNNKTFKTGRLVLFKRVHYNITITLQTLKRGMENFEIPIPFKTDFCVERNSIIFDYRILTLSFKNKEIEKRLHNVKVKNVEPSQYYNNILEISIL
jgi:hypothetical protein